ncbi:hypothetical protein ElyMa_005611200 [Elysia marginata]|uniref:Uncharacterized protein n=1 Tax=Elysia marginata TaxID=1093978 RepID=A0AAV4F6B8_9GAST|nr:hypothetical protein ElyMa_005611200 [Elysia marginata]
MPSLRNRAKKRLLVDSDSQSDESATDIKQQEDDAENISKRCSYRLLSKRERPGFKLPGRDAIWKDIPSVKSPEKLSRITPRKSMNNFTKVYNSYNFDDFEDTGDEESDSDSSSNQDVGVSSSLY